MPDSHQSQERITALERRVLALEQKVLRLSRRRSRAVDPFAFGKLHNIAEDEIQRAEDMQVLPLTKSGKLGAAGKQIFYQVYHNSLPMFLPCKDCPHDA